MHTKIKPTKLERTQSDEHQNKDQHKKPTNNGGT